MTAAAASVLPCLLSVLVFVAWGAFDGGFLPTVWYPGALFLTGLVVVTAVARRSIFAGLPRPASAAIVLLAAFTAWTFASIAWASDDGAAWHGANRTLLYLVVFTLFATALWRASTAAAALGIFALATAVVAVAVFALAVPEDPDRYFIAQRYVGSVGYVNAQCALALLAFWPALFLASRRETPLVLRGPFLASAGMLLEIALTSQSRGSLFAFPITLLLYFAAVPARLRSFVFAAPVLAVVFAFREPFLDLFTLLRATAPADAVVAARTALLVTGAILLVAGTALALVDRFVPFGERVARGARLAAAALALVGVAGALAVTAAADPVERASAGWREFKSGQAETAGGSYLTTGLGSNRYDFWRVAFEEWRRAPLHGIGADNFAIPYVRDRQSGEEPRYPHSLELQILSQTGLVGAALFTAFLASVVWSAFSNARGRSRLNRAVRAVALVTAAYWIVHGSVDWFWEFPALGAPAFAFLGMAAALSRRYPFPAEERRSRSARLAATAAFGLLTIAAAVSFALPWAAAKETAAAVEGWRADPDRAYERLERARALNPLSDDADVTAGAIAREKRDWERMHVAFSRALERNPHNWYAVFELGVAEVMLGRRERGLRTLAAARRLNPRDEIVAVTEARVRAGRRIAPREIEASFAERIAQRTK